MQKKIIIFFLLLFLSSCGYEALHSKKNSMNYDYSISQLDLIGHREINLKIKQKLNNYTSTKKDKDFKLKISSTSERVILAKDTLGDPTTFQIKITITVDVLNNYELKSNFTILEDFNYNNISDKFDLKRYEEEIQNNLAETATDKIIFRLSNV